MAETLSQQALGWAARDTSAVFSPFHFSRRANGAEDVSIKILFCGICHTDLHFAKNDFGTTTYPIVPGHEITGTVTDVGSNIENLFKVGDRVGAGCMVGSCNAPTCEPCKEGSESYCPNVILTYNSVYHDGTPTFGGYSNIIVVNYRYVVQFPEKLALDAGAPLLCAGITVYSPMKYYGMTEAAEGKHLGVVGLGGLGHVAIKFGKALGMRVTVISTSSHKEREAKELLAADDFLVSKDHQQMQGAAKSLDYIIDTASAVHPIEPLLNLLKLNGKLVFVGAPVKPLELPIMPLLFGRKMIGGSLIGGMKETQEMLDFCGEHNITCEIEKISIEYLNTAMKRLLNSDVKYRFVIDIAGTLK
uniref:Cinnamyl alcohol dehydrogenase n=1 Tax=Cunninghamia lanceolata TaxID=28977 RepID=K7YKR9_CUNLA|nr:cinnamyl alcohol dehydrogenase [Cunninghamia lanceolata]